MKNREVMYRPRELTKTAICAIQDLEEFAQMNGQKVCVFGYQTSMKLLLISSKLLSLTLTKFSNGVKSNECL